jgi:hypothetical protein
MKALCECVFTSDALREGVGYICECISDLYIDSEGYEFVYV